MSGLLSTVVGIASGALNQLGAAYETASRSVPTTDARTSATTTATGEPVLTDSQIEALLSQGTFGSTAAARTPQPVAADPALAEAEDEERQLQRALMLSIEEQ
jgi:hypothetical protein